MNANPSPPAHWFVVYTHSRSERHVHALLTQRGLNAFLPLRRIRRNTPAGPRDLDVPLFSNYVFVHTTRQRLRSLAHLPGVAHVVSFGEGPTSVPESEILALRKRCVSTTRRTVQEPRLVVSNPSVGVQGTTTARLGHRRLAVQPPADESGPSLLPPTKETPDQAQAA